MATLPVGAAFGTLVHAVLETADPTADSAAELRRAVRTALAHPRRPSTPRRSRTRWRRSLAPRSARSPRPAASRLAPADQLAELDFELPLAGGDAADPGRGARGTSATSSRCCAGTCPPTTRSPPTRTCSPRFSSPAAARLPHRQHRRRAAPARASGSSSSTTRPTGWGRWARTAGAADRPALRPGPTRRGDDRTRTTRCRRCSTAVALHRFLRWRLREDAATDRERHLGACSTCSCAGCAGRTAGRSTACRAGVLLGGPPPALVTELSRLLDAELVMISAVAVGTPERDPHDPQVARRRRGAGGVQRGGRARCRRRARRRAARAARRRGDEQVLLALALAVRGVRLGSVCVDLAAVGDTVLGEGDELVDVSGLPWPDPQAWRRGVRGEPARRGRGRRAGRAAAAAGRRAALPGAVLAAGGAGPPRAGRAPSRTDRGAVDLDRLRAGLDRLFGDVGRPASTSSGSRPRSPRSAPVTVLAGGPGTGKTTTVARLLALLAADRPGAPAADRAGRTDRQGGGPPGRRPCATRRASTTCPTASTLHRLLGWQPGRSRFRHDRLRPAALRRDRRRRDVDGLADDDGPAARRGAPGRPAGAGRRPGPAGLGRGRRGPRRPRPRPRPSRTRLDAALAALELPVRGRPRGRHARPRLALPRCGRRVRAGVQAGDADEALARAARRHGRPGVRRDGRPAPRPRHARTSSTPGSRSPRPRAAVRRAGGAGRAGAAPGAVRAPPRPVRRGPVEPARSTGGWPRRCGARPSTASGTRAARCS